MIPPDHLHKIRTDLAKRKSSRVRGTGLAESLAKKLSIPVMNIREALSELHEKGELKATDWDPRLGPQGMVTLMLDIPDNPANMAWNKSMHLAHLSSEDANTLIPAADVLSDMSEADQVTVAKGLIKLRDCVHNHVGESRYLVSARYLLGSSKMLDALPSATLKAFGIDPTCFLDAPAYVMTAGPSDPKTVVLVENPQAFERAVKAGVPGVAWVTTYGYGLSRGGDASGIQLAAIIESGQMIAVIRDGNPPSLRDLINHQDLTFWGDLDPAGLHIFHRLQRHLPQLNLSALYQPMINRLKAGDGHPYTKATGKEGQSLQAVSDPVAQSLLKLCAERGVDQETVDEDDCRSYVGAFHSL
jgi:hypothetical protein